MTEACHPCFHDGFSLRRRLVFWWSCLKWETVCSLNYGHSVLDTEEADIPLFAFNSVFIAHQCIWVMCCCVWLALKRSGLNHYVTLKFPVLCVDGVQLCGLACAPSWCCRSHSLLKDRMSWSSKQCRCVAALDAEHCLELTLDSHLVSPCSIAAVVCSVYHLPEES